MSKAMSWMMVTLAVLGLFGGRALAGSLDSPATPTNEASAMWTVENIYNVLDTRTTNVTKRTVVFTEPSAGPTNGTMHTLNDIMALVTNRAPVAKTGVTNSYVTGDDGDLKIGVAWPNPRFSPVATNGAETNQIRDNLTGLIWARNANIASNSDFSASGQVTWSNALNVITNMSTGLVNRVSYGGTNDWRLPNVMELLSLIDWQYGLGGTVPAVCNTEGTEPWTEGDPFVGIQMWYYWTSDAHGPNPDHYQDNIIMTGYVWRHLKSGADTDHVWPVRGGR